MWRENEKIMVACRPSTSSGSFGIPGALKYTGRQECAWETCRDRFRTKGANLPVFWYRIGQADGQNVSAFFDKIETMLKLKVKSSFGPTSCKDLIWVRWAPFWRRYSMRKSLFTALLRVSTRYDREADNFVAVFEEPPHKYKYFVYTKPALDYFLKGNTVYTGATSAGWQNAFYNKTEEMASKLLRRPVKPATP